MKCIANSVYRQGRTKSWLAMALIVSGLGGASCATRAGKGAAVGGASGAVVGAGLGALAGGNKGAVVGAGVGAAAGAGAGALIGRYMDRQQEALEKQVKGAEIIRQGDQIAVRFEDAILFDLNRATLKPSAKDDLTELARVLREYGETDLVIEGHTDSTGPKDFNERLSWDRAESVVKYLADQGVGRDRMNARGYAASRPVASNSNPEGRQRNRRVQVQIAPNEVLQQQASAATESRSTVSTNNAQKVPARAVTR
jgi:outer membrane protein OmpA-like peptidoglycan-associated protein